MSLLDLFKKKGSGDVAKDRLKLLLVSDRANCSPEVMEMIKNDIIKVISKYMVIDAEGLDIQITSTESDTNNGSVPASISVSKILHTLPLPPIKPVPLISTCLIYSPGTIADFFGFR